MERALFTNLPRSGTSFPTLPFDLAVVSRSCSSGCATIGLPGAKGYAQWPLKRAALKGWSVKLARAKGYTQWAVDVCIGAAKGHRPDL